MKITIIGGGIIGLSSAYYLQKEGYTVTVIERGNITDGYEIVDEKKYLIFLLKFQ